MKHMVVGAVSATAITLRWAMAAPAFAQGAEEIETVESELASLGLEAISVSELTSEQVLQIQNVLNTDEDEQSKVRRIEQIVAANPGTGVGAWGVAQLQSSVGGGAGGAAD